MKNEILNIQEIVAGGLCIGCGLCVSMVKPNQLKLVLTPEGRERPVASGALDSVDLGKINAICPGRRVPGAQLQTLDDAGTVDTLWGAVAHVAVSYATDAEVRFRASTGGVLTALGQYLIASGRVEYVLHVSASHEHPMRTTRQLSFDAVSVLEGSGSRYGPAAPLVDFNSLLDRGERFALIAKPCDVAAVRNLAKIDSRVDKLLRYALSISCGGTSDLGKSEEILAKLGIAEHEVSFFKYRGNGNPGPTQIKTHDGRSHELSYNAVWEDEAKWMIQPRCKICPDAIGESADLVATDIWPGGGPSGEDEGFNGIIVRTRRGLELYQAAVAAGAITVDSREVTIRDFDRWQPHQVRKKIAIGARFAAMQSVGLDVPEAIDLRLEECSSQYSAAEYSAERENTLRRVREGRLGEPPASER